MRFAELAKPVKLRRSCHLTSPCNQGRLARAAATLKLSESMGKAGPQWAKGAAVATDLCLSDRFQSKAGVDFLKPLVSAWAALVAHLNPRD